MVVSIQTHEDLANWQPHLHALVTAGLVHRDGSFTPIDPPPSEVAERLFRRRVLDMLVRRGKLDQDIAANLLFWQHSGFSVAISFTVTLAWPLAILPVATLSRCIELAVRCLRAWRRAA